jgi:DNA modification methylase
MSEGKNCKLPKIDIEQLPVDLLIPYVRNSRTHSDEQVAQIAASIREFGFTNPVLVGVGNDIIAGHGRVLAARKLNLKHVPCIRLGHLTDSQKRAYIIADNKLALNAGWDEELLKLELTGLQEDGFDLELTGFNNSELEALLAVLTVEGETDPDEVPDPPVNPVTVMGDIWTLGDHRVMCGDSTNVDSVSHLLGGNDWNALIFDPPYEMENLYFEAMLPQKEAAKLISFWDFKRFAIAAKSAMEFGWAPLYELIWDNVTSWYTPNRPLARHKACGIFGDNATWDFDAAIIVDGKNRKPKKVTNSRGECEYKPLEGAVHLRTVEAFPTTQERENHAHSKPLKWIEAIFRGINKNSFLDLFGGSGSTLIGCEIIGAKSFTMELNPVFVDVIVKRWQDFTGKTATHAETGKSFDEMSAAKNG